MKECASPKSAEQAILLAIGIGIAIAIEEQQIENR
jgi:hypothetical protein